MGYSKWRGLPVFLVPMWLGCIAIAAVVGVLVIQSQVSLHNCCNNPSRNQGDIQVSSSSLSTSSSPSLTNLLPDLPTTLIQEQLDLAQQVGESSPSITTNSDLPEPLPITNDDLVANFRSIWVGPKPIVYGRPGTPPKFIVAGVHKAGTTALFSYLCIHGDVHCPPRKELHYFDVLPIGSRANYYDYLRRFHRIPNTKITGEATPSYTRARRVPRMIKKFFPNIKIILVLREPVSRFASQVTGELHLHCPTSWNISLTMWKDCLTNSGGDEVHCAEVKSEYPLLRSLYLFNLRWWLEAGFTNENLIVIQSEHLKKHTFSTLQTVAQFINLRPFTDLEFNATLKADTGTKYSSDPAFHSCDPIMPEMHEFYEPFNNRLKAVLRARFPQTLNEFWDSKVW